MDFLEKLRNRPLHVRRKIVYAVSISITAIIFIFWISTLGYRFEHREKRKERTRDDLAPFSVIKENFRALTGDIGKGLGSLKKDKENSEEIGD